MAGRLALEAGAGVDPGFLRAGPGGGARKRAEEEILELNANLEQRVAQRTAELHVKNEELEMFSCSVSHDLKAPLRGLDGYSRLLLEDHHDRLDEEGRQFLRNIRGAAAQMQELIDDLLAYSKIERRSLSPGWNDPRVMIQGLLAERGPDLNGVEVSVELGRGGVVADREGLALVLRNLIDHALRWISTSRYAPSASAGWPIPWRWRGTGRRRWR